MRRRPAPASPHSRPDGPSAASSAVHHLWARAWRRRPGRSIALRENAPIDGEPAGRVGATVLVMRTDAALLAAVADGDRAALRELHDRHMQWITARLARRCSDPDVVAEAVQDMFVAVWRSAGRWDGSGEPAAWMWGIAIRRLIGVLRTRSRWSRIRRPATDREDIVVAAEDQVLVGVEHGDLAGAMAQLSPELRAVVQATVLDGLTTREAARLLNVPQGTVKTRMMRARAELRGALA